MYNTNCGDRGKTGDMGCRGGGGEIASRWGGADCVNNADYCECMACLACVPNMYLAMTEKRPENDSPCAKSRPAGTEGDQE